MAILTDVLAAIVNATAAAIYPDGTGAPSVAGIDCQIYAGWPAPQQLSADITAGKAHVSVFPRPDTARNTTRYPDDWQPLAAPAVTLTATIAGNTLTLGGTVTAGNLVVAVVAGVAYPYVVQAGDTLAAIATALAALIAVDVVATTASDAVVTVPATVRLETVRLGGQGTALRPLITTRRTLQVSVWAPDPDSRATLAATALAALADVRRLAMADGTQVPVFYAGDEMFDSLEKLSLYRQEIFWDVEYTAVASGSFTSVTATGTSVGAL